MFTFISLMIVVILTQISLQRLSTNRGNFITFHLKAGTFLQQPVMLCVFLLEINQRNFVFVIESRILLPKVQHQSPKSFISNKGHRRPGSR